MPRAVVVSVALGLTVAEVAVPAVQTPPGLVRLAQSLLGTGVPVALVVERQDLARNAGRELSNTDPGVALELLQSEGGAWEVSREPVIRIARRVRPREVDEALTSPVHMDDSHSRLGAPFSSCLGSR